MAAVDFLLVVTGDLVDAAVLLVFTVVPDLAEVTVVERGVVVVDGLVDVFLTVVVVAGVPVAGLAVFGLTVTPAAAKEDALRTLVASGIS